MKFQEVRGCAGLAPMAGVSDAVMRLLCHEMGARWTVSEMLSAKGWIYSRGKNRNALQLLQRLPGEGDGGLQLFGRDLRAMGSQGQLRTAVLSMKLGEIRLIEKEMGESPTLLLDDVFSELDAKRRNALFKSAAPLQTFITCTDRQDAAGARADCFLRVTPTPDGTVLSRE